jgi:hypothetical protein
VSISTNIETKFKAAGLCYEPMFNRNNSPVTWRCSPLILLIQKRTQVNNNKIAYIEEPGDKRGVGRWE